MNRKLLMYLEEYESFMKKTIIFMSKKNNNLTIKVIIEGGRISSIENDANIRFPFSVGQLLSRNVEVWACNNNFYMDGKDTCPEKKVFGIRTSDIPHGHELRHLYPNKFK